MVHDRHQKPMGIQHLGAKDHVELRDPVEEHCGSRKPGFGGTGEVSGETWTATSLN